MALDRAELEGIYRKLDEIEKVELKTASYRPRRPLFHWPLGAAAAAARPLLPGDGAAARALARGARLMPAALAEFHFLRPQWLWLALPAALVVWLVLRSEDPARPFRKLIAPHLLPHLLVGPGRPLPRSVPRTWWRSSCPS